jgi:hypothetical protein
MHYLQEWGSYLQVIRKEPPITSSVGRKALAGGEKARKFEAPCLTNEKLRTGNKSSGIFSWLKPTGMG